MDGETRVRRKMWSVSVTVDTTCAASRNSPGVKATPGAPGEPDLSKADTVKKEEREESRTRAYLLIRAACLA
ncbi:MAG: hypothetical protein DMG33_17005 [Acidobacteria bacterium]|nr:MAG: hypothetical protein DMG33_17005 [Acidobacteriota bacterium]